MKKSVRIRKAGPGEKPGYYNKTANFLNKALPKANQGLQVQERLKVIMNDTYASLRDGADPNTIFETLVTKYGIEQKMAFAIINRVMTVLAQKGYKDPAYLEEEEEEDTAQGNNPQAANPTPQPTPQPAPTNTNDDEDIALAESDMPSGYDGMQHLDSGSEQYAQQGAFQYGGYYDDGGEYDDDYTNYFAGADSPQDAVIDQYSNPGKLSAEKEIPFDLSRLIKFTPGAQNIPQTPDLSYYLGSYRPVADEGNIPQDLLPANKYGGLNKFAGGGPGPGKGKRGRKAKTQAKSKTRETVVEPVEPTVAPVESVGPQRTVTPQESAVTPSTWQNYQNFFGKRNPLSDRGFFGTRVENLGTVLNTVRPQNWREKWREQVAPSTTTTKIITDINALIENDKYEPSVLQKNADNTYSTGLGFNLDPALADFLLKSTEEFNMLSNKKKPTEIDIQSLGALLGGVGMPESIAPELDFLSIHKQNNGKLKFTKDENGLFKVEILSEVPTRLKGYNKSSIKLKDEIIIDPKTKEILDPKTKLPLEIVDKNYYMGNQLNWYNSPYRFPFTSKFPGLDLSKYPQIISESPLKKEPVSGWNTAWNMIGKPMAFSPMSFPFTYPRFAARSKFYPNASNVKTQYFGKQREIGPQAPGGMTFGDQPFGAQYADYSLLKDRNYKTGLGFLKTAGILGGLGYLGYNQFLQEPDKDFIYDRGMDQFVPVSNEKFEGAGRVGNDPTFGITRSGMDKDSMIIQGGDTINDKGWGTPSSDDFKRGGAQKKQFVKNVMSKFAPGGELGKGNRMDNGKVSEKKNNFVTKLKAQSDKVVTEDLYAAVQKSGDPQLMNIFMGNNQQQQPQDNQMMQQPQFGEMGGYVNMDVENPLTRFIYGGDPCPEGSYWNGIECVPYAPGVPTREDLFNNPTNLDYLNKLNLKRNVQEYNKWRENKLDEYIKQNYKGPENKWDENDNSIPEWREFLDSEEFQKLHESLPDPEYSHGPFNFPEGYEQKDYYPKEEDWDEKSKKELNNLFNSEADQYEIIRKFLEENPDYKEEYYDKGFDYIYDNLTPEQKSKHTPKIEELRKSRYNDWCPCSKTQEILVQGKPVQQKICVPCEQAKTGGYISRNSKNSLNRFIYGGYEDPAFYEPYSLPEAGGGITMPPGGSGGQYIADKMSPALDQNTFETNPNNDDIVENPTTKCPPGTMWSKTYNQCVPIMQYKLNPKVVRGRSSLANTLIPINPIFRSYLTDQPKTSRRDNPYSRKNLRQFGKENRYRVLPMLLARDAGRGDRRFNSYGMQQFLSRSMPFGAFLQPRGFFPSKYANGGISDTSEGDLNLQDSSFSQSGYDPSTYAPQSTEVQNLNAQAAGFYDPNKTDEQGNRTTNYLNNSMFPGVNNTQEKPNDTNYYDPTQYRKVTQMDGEAFNNGLNAVANFTSGMINNLQNNPRSLATTYQATNLFNQVPITNAPYAGQQQDMAQNMGTFGPQQGNDRNSLSTFGNYPGVSKYGGYMEYGGFADPYNDEEIYMTDEEIQDYLARGGEIEYL